MTDSITDTLSQKITQDAGARARVVDVDEPVEKLVIFRLGDDLFAFHGELVREILVGQAIYFVPGCPESMLGVINLRGAIESVIRIDAMLGLPDAAASAGAHILLCRAAGLASGVGVEEVLDVSDIAASALQPPPAALSAALRPYVRAVLQYGAAPVALLDLARIFEQYAGGLA